MSSNDDPSARAIAQQTRAILKGAGAQLAGKQRGRDREVRRNSYDVDDPRAKPWSKIGRGTIGEGLAHREALLQTAREHHQHFRLQNPPTRVREARHRRRMIDAELAHLASLGPSAPGVAATLRAEATKLDQLLASADAALRKIDVEILRALIELVDFATGKLFPTIDTIAARAACHRNSVVESLKRLKKHGFVTWVRRSIATGNDHAFAPQREQTSNAYYFEHRQSMASRTWQRFVQLLAAKLRRLGKAPAMEAPAALTEAAADPHGLHAALAALGVLVANAST